MSAVCLARLARWFFGVSAVLLASAGAWSAEPAKAQRYAFLVGINEYQHPKLRQLDWAENDAGELADLLHLNGYQVVLLTGSAKEESQRATQANIDKQLHELMKKCQKGDMVLAALAGHGIQFQGQKDCFFCPVDARPFMDQAATLVSLEKVYQELDKSLAGMKVLLVDASRDHPQAGRGRGINADTAPRPPQGVAALFSCRAGEKAYEHDKLKHGVFFYHVIQGLQGKAVNKTDPVTFTGLAAYVNRAVPLWIGENIPGVKQSPSQKVDYAPEPVLLAPLPPSDWPRFLGPLGTSVSLEKGIIAPWPKKGLRIVWQKPLGTGYAMPSISKGRLFLFDRQGDRARLSCLKSDTGEVLWKFDYPTRYEDFFGYNNGPRCCPVIDANHAYIFGAEGMLHCVRADDGKLVWKVDTQKEFGVVPNFFGVGSTPVIEGALLIVQVGGSPATGATSPREDLKGNGSGIVAFDKRTGKVRYRVTDELASYASPVLATIDGRRWCFVFARSGLIGMEPGSGKVDFRYPWRAKLLESVNASNPVVVGDHVFISECYGPGSALLKVKQGGYEVVWDDAKKLRKKTLQCHWNTPIHHEGYLYACSGRNTSGAELRCVELASGKIMWSVPGLALTSLLMVDGHFICLSEDGVLRLLRVNPEKYEEISRLEISDPKPLLEYPCWAAPILSQGLLYVRGKDRLVCLELIQRVD